MRRKATEDSRNRDKRGETADLKKKRIKNDLKKTA